MDKEQIQTKVFEWVQGAAEKVGEFAEKEVPPFIHEYLTWKFYEALVPIILYSLFLIGVFVFLRKPIKWGWEWCIQEMEDSGGVSIGVGGLISAFCLIAAAMLFPYGHIMTCIQIKIAPKIFLVEKASEIIKESQK